MNSTRIGQNKIESRLNDMTLEISKLSKKLENYNSFQEKVELMLQEEAKLRQNVEKKTLVLNENFTRDITCLKDTQTNIDKVIESKIEKLKNELLVDINNTNNKFLSKFESSVKNYHQLEKHLANIQDNKSLELQEVASKLSIFEEITSNQFGIIKNEINSCNNKIVTLESTYNNNMTIVQKDISKLKESVNSLQNEMTKLYAGKFPLVDSMTKINDQLSTLENKSEKMLHDYDLMVQEIQAKLKHYENINKMINDHFLSIKNDVFIQIEDFNNSSSNNLAKIKENFLNEIKEVKLDNDKFHINIINENQKFIDYIQEQLNSRDSNIKKLFEYTNDDVDVLKKKSEALENIIKNIRSEMIGNINRMEGFLTQRYDTVFRTLNSERTPMNY